MSKQTLIRRPIVANLHDDWSIEIERYRLAGEVGSLGRIYAPKMRRGGLDFTFYTVGGDDVMFTSDPDLQKGTLRTIAGLEQELEATDEFRVCTTADEVRRTKEDGKLALMLTVEGADAVGRDLQTLHSLYASGLRSVILTWFRSNCVGDGVGERRGAGLTNYGVEFVQEMQRLGMLVDLSQSSAAVIDDVLEISTRPVIASHSNASAVHDHRRNLTDDQLRGIADTGGVVGFTVFPAHVGPEPTLDAYLDHIEHAIAVIGAEHVALGLNIVVHTADEAKRFYERSTIEYSTLALPGVEDIDQFSNIGVRLAARGLDAGETAGITGENLMRVVEKAVR